MAEIERLITQTEQWAKWHRSNGASIEAAACAISLKALKDAKEAIERSER